MQFSVKLHTEHGVNTLTHSGLLFFNLWNHPHFHCIEYYRLVFPLILWLLCGPNQSGNIQWSTYILVVLVFWIVDTIVMLFVWLIVFLRVVFTVMWMIQHSTPAKPILSVWDVFRCTIDITFRKMAVYFSDSLDIQWLSSSSGAVLYSTSWRHRLCSWHGKCRRSIILKVTASCFDDFFSIGNVSYSCYLHVFALEIFFV